MEGNRDKQVSLYFEPSRPGDHSTGLPAASTAVPRHSVRQGSNFSENKIQHGLLISVHLELNETLEYRDAVGHMHCRFRKCLEDGRDSSREGSNNVLQGERGQMCSK